MGICSFFTPAALLKYKYYSDAPTQDTFQTENEQISPNTIYQAGEQFPYPHNMR
jgi:hypothetical protein